MQSSIAHTILSAVAFCEEWVKTAVMAPACTAVKAHGAEV